MKKLRAVWTPLVAVACISLVFALTRDHPPASPQISDIGSAGSSVTAQAVQQKVPSDSDQTASIQEVIEFWARIGVVEFPHEMHVEDIGMECVECHHETNAATLNIPHQDYFEDFWIKCSTCHKSNGETVLGPQACSDCHHSDPVGIADETLSSKVVVHRLCWDCHDSGTGVDASESCSSCHFGAKTSFLDPLPESLRSQ